MVYFLCNTSPLSFQLKNTIPSQFKSICLPSMFSGHKLSFLPSSCNDRDSYDPLPHIPTTFWHSRTFQLLPLNPAYRRTLCYDLFDLHHLSHCTKRTFHPFSTSDCTCSSCSLHLHPYHIYACPSAPVENRFPPRIKPFRFNK